MFTVAHHSYMARADHMACHLRQAALDACGCLSMRPVVLCLNDVYRYERAVIALKYNSYDDKV